MTSPGDYEHLANGRIPPIIFDSGNDKVSCIANKLIEIDEMIKTIKISTTIIIDFFS
jgi:hypothetical protein